MSVHPFLIQAFSLDSAENEGTREDADDGDFLYEPKLGRHCSPMGRMGYEQVQENKILEKYMSQLVRKDSFFVCLDRRLNSLGYSLNDAGKTVLNDLVAFALFQVIGLRTLYDTSLKDFFFYEYYWRRIDKEMKFSFLK